MKKKVEIFIGPISCSCAGGITPARQEKVGRAFLLKRALEKIPDRFTIRLYSLGNETEYDEGMPILESYLKNSGERELAEHLAFSLNLATPAIAVDGELISIGDVPSLEDFLSRIE